MIGDIFVGALLLISGFINVLAIGAFWITPSLRTTANRFVINLLLVNFISCLILSPFAFNVNANSSESSIASPNTTSPSIFLINNSNNVNNSSQFATDVVSKVDNNVTTVAFECSNQTLECLNQTKQSGASNESYYSRKQNFLERIGNFSMRKYQTWSLDLVVALSVLSVLLVILDTFIAVTDPLRYHSRISDLKAWLLIALCWILSIVFGIASALRTSASDKDSILSDSESHSISDGIVDDNVYNMMFLLTYFLLIIIMPFLLVILMYWRIYSEARESGQRMRQNGSSPLLQSALNLAATANAHPQHSTILTNPQCMLLSTSSPHHHHHHHHSTNKQLVMNKQDSSCANYLINNNNNNNNTFNHNNNNQISTNFISDGLTMRIDSQNFSINNHHRDRPMNLNINGISNGAYSNDNHATKTFLLSSPPHECLPMLIDETSMGLKSQQHQNILLTLTTVCEQTIKRNHSVKHLHLLTESDFNGHDDESKVGELRQVQSTPNLQNITSPEQLTNNQDQMLELPSIQASPKALRYMTSLRHRLSNASSLFKYREEGRAARISILVVIMFLITYLPYGILLLVHGQESIIKESNITLLSIIFVLLANLCSPIIFAYRNKRVRRGVRRLLGVDKKTNERLEKLNSLKRTCSTRIKNYRQNNLNKSLNLGSGGIKANNIRRTKSFQTCNYLTPSDAAKISLNNTVINNHSNISFSNESPVHVRKSPTNMKEKKSILKIVADSSRKFRCQFTNCQNGINQDQMMPVEV